MAAPVEITVDGTSFAGKDMRDAFDDYFLSRSTECAALTVDNSYFYSSNCWFRNPMTCSEVYSAFMNMKNRQSRDADDVHMMAMECALDILTRIVTEILNVCLNSGVFLPKCKRQKFLASSKRETVDACQAIGPCRYWR